MLKELPARSSQSIKIFFLTDPLFVVYLLYIMSFDNSPHKKLTKEDFRLIDKSIEESIKEIAERIKRVKEKELITNMFKKLL